MRKYVYTDMWNILSRVTTERIHENASRPPCKIIFGFLCLCKRASVAFGSGFSLKSAMLFHFRNHEISKR